MIGAGTICNVYEFTCTIQPGLPSEESSQHVTILAWLDQSSFKNAFFLNMIFEKTSFNKIKKCFLYQNYKKTLESSYLNAKEC